MMRTILKCFKVLALFVLLTSAIAFVAYFMYAFYRYETNLFGIRFVNPIYSFVSGIPVWLYLVLFFSFFSLVNASIFTSLSLFYDHQRSRSAKQKAKYLSYFTYLLSNYFVADIYKDEVNRANFFKRIKPFVKYEIQLKAFLESYLRLQELMADNLSPEFKQLIDALNIQNKIESFLYHKDFDNKILSMKVLSYLRITTSIDQILLLAENKNFVIRTEAYAALIRLMENDDFLVGFIGEKHSLSFIDINMVVNAVLKNRKMNIDYRALLASDSPRKVMIGLLLAKYRYEKSSKNTILIINHIGNQDVVLNKLAWDALLSTVPQDETMQIIIELFDQQPDEVKLLILEHAHNILDQRFYSFLVEIVEYQSVLVMIEAMKIIFENDFNLLSTFESSQNVEIKMAYNETACMYINQ
ncbi:hypothetical protein ACT3CD_08050 [Geofilum sp. OHC36d9]|uniref:hypothetical protein n=1 Tax=Geofilum sp. OHC36d9 TaxID=3458413 RepID=UPI0040332929